MNSNKPLQSPAPAPAKSDRILVEPSRRVHDALSAYQNKRNFSLTPEPRGETKTTGSSLSFVIHKHWASSLHYDFRLELDGVLKSWAIPKGPSFDPKSKRMAVQVEDHPMSYASFEGVIPPKQYGSGKVIVWDSGTWTPIGDPHQGYRDGNLKFVLQGHKLLGRWVLVRMNAKNERQTPWLLIKEKDAFARTSAEYNVVDESPNGVSTSPLLEGKSDTDRISKLKSLRVGAILTALPDKLSPQLATWAAVPPADGANWLYEIKYDGYRLLLRIDGRSVRLITRNGHDWTEKLQSLRDTIIRMKLPNGWYDGEIVLVNDDGIPDFGALQKAFDTGDTVDIVLYLFDLPYFDGHDLRAVPLELRRDVLKDVLASSPSERVRFSEVFQATPQTMLAAACKLGLEGVIAKRRGSIYQSSRSSDWIKLKCSQRQEFVIGGFTEPQGERFGFGALLLGVYDIRGGLQYAGDVGSGFNQNSLASITRLLKTRVQAVSPFDSSTKIKGKPHWVAPTLVAEVSFAEWTRSGRIRHAVFRGLRSDKVATAIVREKSFRLDSSKASASSASVGSPVSALRVHVTNPQRVIDQTTGTTKMDIIRYYDLVAKLMMKHLKSRPVSLVRAPTGIDGQLFFQKHAETDKLSGIRQLDPSLHLGHAAMIEVANSQGLLSAAQWNVVEFHTQNTSTTSLEHPDRMVFDLDPGVGVSWEQVLEGTQLTRSFLKQLGLPAFLKTSGGKGLHIVVPLRKLHDWDTVKGLAQTIVQHLTATIPQRFVAKSGPKNRVGKIFIDYLRNGVGATTVCAWSARARPGLGISVPVAWSEMSSLRGGDHWNVATVHERLHTGNEPWNEYAKAARSLATAMAALKYQPPRGLAPNKEI